MRAICPSVGGAGFTIVLVFSCLLLFILISCGRHPKVQICLIRTMALFYFLFFLNKKYFLGACTPSVLLEGRAFKNPHKIPLYYPKKTEDGGNFSLKVGYETWIGRYHSGAGSYFSGPGSYLT